MKVITIGRSEECSVVVNDVKVSRVHAQLVQDDEGKVSVVDLGSTNGTWVNGNRIVGEMSLNPNDIIRIGSTQLPWQTYINNMSSQQVQPELSHSVASTTVLEASDDTPATPPVKKSQRKTMWIVVAIVLALCAGGGAVWLFTRPNTGNTSNEGRVSSTDTHDPTNTQKNGQGTESTIVKDSLDSIIQSDYEQALKDAAKREKDEAKRLQNELKKTQDSLKKIEDSYNAYPSAKEKQERDLKQNIQRLDASFKNLMNKTKEKNEHAIYLTYRKLVDQKLITKKIEDLYTKEDVEEDEEDILKYHNSRCGAIRNCFNQFKDNKEQDKMQMILNILEESLK